MKRFKSISLLFGLLSLLLIISCSSDDDSISNNNAQNDIENNVQSGTWRIALCKI